MTDTSPLRDDRAQSGAQPQRMRRRLRHGGAGQTYRSLVNPSCRPAVTACSTTTATPARTLPAMSDPAPVNRPRNPYCKEGS